MDSRTRHCFDNQLEFVLGGFPERIHKLIDEVPLCVEDYPSNDVLAKTGIKHRYQLCGLYTGVPLTQRSVLQSGRLPDVVTVYREGVLNCVISKYGHVTIDGLRKEIQITILHELAHHHGLGEEELKELGYG